MVSPLNRIAAPPPSAFRVEDDDRRLNGVFTKPSPSPLAGVQTLFQRDEHIGRSPLPLHQANQTGRDGFLVHKTSIRDEDVESLGADITLKTSATTDKILARTGVSGFDELGAILVVVQSKADELDPSSIAKKGIAGWIQRRFGNLKAELTLRLKNADQVFQKLEGKIADHAAVQSEWIKDLETSYAENLERYSRIRSTIEKGRLWEAAMLSELESWPAIDPQDPDALMKGQARRDAEARLNRLRIKLDGFLRLQAVTENRAPRIRSQQETARTVIDTLRDLARETIPVIRDEFALYLQSLDANKSVELVGSTRDLASKTLTRSADGAKEAAVGASRTLNAAAISNETLTHLRTRMIETLTEVRRIETDATQKRTADAKAIEADQAQYLQILQQHKAI